jgi:RHS repeat-associated protein
MWQFQKFLCAFIVAVFGVTTGQLALAQTDVLAAKTPSLRVVPGLEEPLIAVAPTSKLEDAALEAAIAAFHHPSKPPTDFTDLAQPFVAFLSQYPQSAWRMAVLTNLGLGFYKAGYFTKATDAWEKAWNAGRGVTAPQAKALTDRAVGELARMHARVGHAKELERLFADMGERAVSGPATEMIAGAQEGLWSFRNEPELSYLCGPMALKNVLLSQKAAPAKITLMDEARSGPNGFTLMQVSQLASKAGIKHRLIHRLPGQQVPVPSVISWKMNHYAAIVDEKDGRYLIQDPTFGSTDQWITVQAIDAEASGYFLVPDTARNSASWRTASAAEANRVYGMGRTLVSQPGATTANDESKNGGGVCSKGMCVADAKLMLVSLSLNDTPVGYQPPRGPSANIRLTYNQREAGQPANFSFFNVSPKWTLNLLSWIEDNPAIAGNNVERHAAGGGLIDYPSNYNALTGQFSAETQSHAVLSRVPFTSNGAVTYELRMPDGSKQVFGRSDGAMVAPRRVFLTQIVDPAGNALTLNYDAQLRLTSITDASGRNTTLSYAASTSPWLVTRITDPFGRYADLQYDSAGRLASITDVIGLTSSFSYDAGGLINAMTTPYGISTFTYGQNTSANSRFLQMTDPMGLTERIEFMHQAPGISTSDAAAPPGVSNIYLDYRNTFHWDKHAFQVAAGNYLQARRTHWLHNFQSQTSPIVESIKLPLESRVWLTYPGGGVSYFEGTSATPISRRRVLDDGSAQVSSFTYNGASNLLSATDPVGRTTSLTYAANGIDVLSAQQKGAAGSAVTVASFTHNGQHLPLTSTDAAGQTASYSYNGAGQLASATDALGKTTRYVYDDIGRLMQVVNANGAPQLSLIYDGFDRVASSTGSEGYTQTYSYDALDRVSQIGYPDGTTVQYGYDKLDRVSVKDRLGRTTRFAYDANRRLVSVTDPLGQTTGYAYHGNGALRSLTDPNGNVTSWDIDVQGRPVAKRYADGTAETYAYESAGGRLKSVTDALGQTKTVSYTADNRPASLSYLNARIATPGVSYIYDGTFPRVASMTDGIGTTTYAYNPVGGVGGNQLAAVTSPVAGQARLTDTVAYTYDGLGRVVAQSVNGVIEKRDYDALDRTTTVENALGKFNYGYVGSSGRVASVAASSGPQVTMGYFGANGDEMLKRIAYTTPTGAPLATYAYTYDSNDNVTTFTEALSGKTLTAAAGITGIDIGQPLHPTMTAAQASGVSATGHSTASLVAAAFAAATALMGLVGWLSGKAAWRRRSLRIAAPLVALTLMASCGGGGDSSPSTGGSGNGGSPITGTPNTGTGSNGGGGTTVPMTPSANATAQVTTYRYDGADRLTAASIAFDTSRSTSSTSYAYGYDKASNLIATNTNGAIQSLAVNSTNALSSGGYNANGNPLVLGGTKYSWDAANRIVIYNGISGDSIFTYDGQDRLVRIVDRQGGAVISDKSYIWCGLERCGERDNTVAGAPVNKRYFGQGVAQNNIAYQYVADRLGSVRQLVDASGISKASYEFDPYGNRNKTSGDIDSDASFASLFKHNASGLDFAVYRGYDAQRGRWLNRDPISEKGGLNLYSYAGANPANKVDPTGEIAIVDNAAAGLIQVALGLALSNALGQQYTACDAAIDFGLGFATNGLSVLIKVRRLARFAETAGAKISSTEISNAIPSELARVIPGKGPYTSLGLPGESDVFVTAAEDIAGLTAEQISKRLAIPASDTFTVIRFPTPKNGLASPVLRSNPGFIGGGRTFGGAREFIIPNGPIPSGSNISIF